MTTHNDHITLVLGATGKTGRRIARRLDQRGVAVRRGSRASEPKFDWDNHSTWAPALQGTSAAYVSFFPDVAVPGAPDTIAEFAELAVKLGARRLVLLSGRGETEAQRAEQALQASGADWTVVRCSWFMQNFSESFLLDPVLAGEVALPVGTVGEPFVDAEDIADVATAALTEDGHAGELYELTGPRLLTFEQAVAEIADATGRPIRYVPITVDEAVLGAKVEVPTLDGRKALTIPPGSSSGQKLRLRGQGVPASGSLPAGDLFVVLKIIVPKGIDEESRHLIEEFSRRNPHNPRAGLW